jgi:hypothetical protein
MRIILYVLVNLTEVQNHGIMNAFFGLIQLIIALLLAVVALSIGYTIFSNITKGMDKKRAEKRKYRPGIHTAAIRYHRNVVQSGLIGTSSALSRTFLLPLNRLIGGTDNYPELSSPPPVVRSCSVFIWGKRITSLIELWLVRSITSRSIPRPTPPVGGIP